MTATGGELPIIFTVQGVTYSVLPNTTTPVVISGLLDGPTPIAVFGGGIDFSFIATTHCDLAPTYRFSQVCAANFDDTVTVTVGNSGDDLDVTFTINGTDHVLHPGESLPVVIANLPDGPNTITLSINGVPQNNIVVESDCNPTFSVAAVCNSVDINGAITGFWFNVTNAEATDITVNFNGGGTVTVPANQSAAIQSATAPLVLTHNGETIAQAAAIGTICERSVTVTKTLQGQPATGETYTVQVSRLVNGTYVPDLTFDIIAGETKTINLPSTLDPAGVDYKIDEINRGSASTTTISPNQLTLSGHLGETVAVVVTNGYASVQIVASSPVVTTAASDPILQLPRTGAAHVQQMLTLGFSAVLVGGFMLVIGRRRRMGVR